MRVLHVVQPRHLFRADAVVLGLLHRAAARGEEVALCCVVESLRRPLPLVEEAIRTGFQAGALVLGRFGSPPVSTLRERALGAGVELVHAHDLRAARLVDRAFRGEKVLRFASYLGLEADRWSNLLLARRAARSLTRFDHVVALARELEDRAGRCVRRALGDRLDVVNGDADIVSLLDEIDARLAAASWRHVGAARRAVAVAR